MPYPAYITKFIDSLFQIVHHILIKKTIKVVLDGAVYKTLQKKKNKEHLEGYALFSSHTGTSNQVYEWREIKWHIHQKGWSNRNSPVPYNIPQIEITSDTDACGIQFFFFNSYKNQVQKTIPLFHFILFHQPCVKKPHRGKKKQDNDSSFQNSNWMRICLEHLNFKKCETSRNGDL